MDQPNVEVHPGLRSDNEFLQYKAMSEQELQDYWKKPFSAKPETGFYAWTKPQIVLSLSEEEPKVSKQSFLTNCFMTFFGDGVKRGKFIKLNSSEEVKGQDCFSYLKATFYYFLFEAFGCEMINHFSPYLKTFCSSTEECEQICASEMTAGMMRGMFFSK